MGPVRSATFVTPFLALAACGPQAIKIHGVVAYQNTPMATQVKVLAYCQTAGQQIDADANGRYQLEMDPPTGCTSLTLSFVKEGALPQFRVLPVPLPDRELELNVSLIPLLPISCGTDVCQTPDEKLKFSTG